MLKRGIAADDLDTREIVDAPVAFTDHPSNLSDTDVRSVGLVERATRMVARRDDREDHRAQDRFELIIKRAIDEDGLGGGWCTPRH